MAIISRDLGRDVPPHAQDTESESYYAWLSGILQEIEFQHRNSRPASARQTVIPIRSEPSARKTASRTVIIENE
jgi:hypothetical protein